ncbi:MAG: SprT family zinc-dependent metalloprotease [Paracoccus sp. (in: a-proteobacteria)]|nr:SprT family zinc-dependent metalloprotease [Paracoccus sp. (in: a-proteobacteria)]
MADHITVGDDIRVTLRRNGRARRLTLRVTRAGGEAVMTLPPGASLAEARAFAESRAGWLRAAQGRAQEVRRVGPGAVLPVAGQGLQVEITPGLRRVQIEGARLLLPDRGAPGRIVAAWLKGRAQLALRDCVTRHAGALNREVRAMSLRDTRSRWGSCTHDGRLMFSWRLAMAPPEVLDYVAAHEVAHLAHMDHSPAFWAAVARLMPDYVARRDWLRVHGAELQAWRFDEGV